MLVVNFRPRTLFRTAMHCKLCRTFSCNEHMVISDERSSWKNLSCFQNMMNILMLFLLTASNPAAQYTQRWFRKKDSVIVVDTCARVSWSTGPPTRSDPCWPVVCFCCVLTWLVNFGVIDKVVVSHTGLV